MLYRLADIQNGDIICDPMAGGGSISIEVIILTINRWIIIIERGGSQADYCITYYYIFRELSIGRILSIFVVIIFQLQVSGPLQIEITLVIKIRLG